MIFTWLLQARVVAASVQHWEQAAALDTSDPLPPHLLGSFVFVTCGLPWVAARALRGLSPGLKKYAYSDALAYLLESERLQPRSRRQYCVTNRSMIGRIYAQQGDKAQVSEQCSSTRMRRRRMRQSGSCECGRCLTASRAHVAPCRLDAAGTGVAGEGARRVGGAERSFGRDGEGGAGGGCEGDGLVVRGGVYCISLKD